MHSKLSSSTSNDENSSTGGDWTELSIRNLKHTPTTPLPANITWPMKHAHHDIKQQLVQKEPQNGNNCYIIARSGTPIQGRIQHKQ
jgi:hypothetical protein